MVYKKNYKRAKRGIQKRGGRSRFMKAGASAGSMAYSALKMAKRLKDMVNTEYKFYDQNVNASYDHTGNLNILNTPAQGQTDTTRIGDSIKVQNLTLRGYIYANAAAVSTLFRIMVLWDPQNKSTATSDILANVASVYAPISPKNYDKKFQTRVLHDKCYSIVSGGADSAMRQFDVVIPVNQHTQFEAGSTTINTGALKILLISAAGVNLPTCVYTARVTYTDN